MARTFGLTVWAGVARVQENARVAARMRRFMLWLRMKRCGVEV
jgi:hypothetical protein